MSFEAPSTIVGVEQAKDRRRCPHLFSRRMNSNERHLLLDSRNTSISFEVPWFGVWTVRGTFGRLHGALELGEERLEQSSVRLDVEAASVDTGIKLRDRHLRGARFLHADLHPFISFKSTAVCQTRGQIAVEGVLSLRGTEVAVRSTCPLDDMGGDTETLRLCGGFSVSRHQCKIGVPNGLAGLNPTFPAIADSVRISVQIRVPAARFRPVLHRTEVR